MSHLGSHLSALADGQLPPAAAERALAHVAACPGCAQELAAAREARRTLAAAFDVPPAPDLTRRLLALGSSSGVARAATRPAGSPSHSPSHSTVGFSGSVPLPGRPDARMPAGVLHGDLRRARRVPARALVGAGSAAGVFVAALLAVGGLPDVVPTSHRAHALTVLGRAGSEMSQAPTGGLAAPVRAGSVAGAAVQNAVLPWTEPTSSGDPRGTGDGADGVVDLTPAGAPDLSAPDAPDRVAAWMGAHGWSPFATLPDGYRATALRLASGPGRTLELDLEGADGVVVVLLQRGRLDPAVAEGWTAVDVEGGPVHLVSSTPRHGVWQSGDTVVSVVAEESDALLALVESYPPQPYDGGVTARLTRGLDVLAGAWKP